MAKKFKIFLRCHKNGKDGEKTTFSAIIPTEKTAEEIKNSGQTLEGFTEDRIKLFDGVSGIHIDSVISEEEFNNFLDK